MASASNANRGSASSMTALPEDAWRTAWRSTALQELQSESQSQTARQIRNSRWSSQWHPVLPHVRILRVNQVDASRLDVEMIVMLKEQLSQMFSLFQAGFLSPYEPELMAFLEFLVIGVPIWMDRPTPGNALMNLRYRNERAFSSLSPSEVRTGLEGPGLSRLQKLLCCIGMIWTPYAWNRINSASVFHQMVDSEQGSRWQKVWRILKRAESLYKMVAFLNLLSFLMTGRYRTVVERLAGARLVYNQPNMNRAVSFEYMNRQLIWQELSELLLLVLPLISMTSIKNAIASPFSSMFRSDGTVIPDDACSICKIRPVTVPFRSLPCDHLFCYYCLRVRLESGNGFKCPRCTKPITAMMRQGRKGADASQSTSTAVPSTPLPSSMSTSSSASWTPIYD